MVFWSVIALILMQIILENRIDGQSSVNPHLNRLTIITGRRNKSNLIDLLSTCEDVIDVWLAE